MKKIFLYCIVFQIGWLVMGNWDTIDTFFWVIFNDGGLAYKMHFVEFTISQIFWSPDPAAGQWAPSYVNVTSKLIGNYLPTLVFFLIYVFKRNLFFFKIRNLTFFEAGFIGKFFWIAALVLLFMLLSVIIKMLLFFILPWLGFFADVSTPSQGHRDAPVLQL